MKTKKIISALTALMLTASMMAGCGEKPADDKTSEADSSTANTTTAEEEKSDDSAEEKPADEDTTSSDDDVTDDETTTAQFIELTGGQDGMVDNMKLVSLKDISRSSANSKNSENSRVSASAEVKARKWSDKKAEDKKKLTLMVYMVGSDLESKQNSMAGTQDILEMIKSGLDDKDVNLVLYCGGAKTWWLNGFPTGKNAYIEYKTNGADLTADGKKGINIYETDRKNMGESDTFGAFLKDVPEKYPADDYALICWDHGGGPVIGYGSDELNTDAKTGGGDSLTMSEMKKALEASPFKSKKLAFIGFDACLMSSLEIADMCQPYADYLVASADTEPGCGWNYEFLGGVKGTSKAKDIGSSIVKTYFDFLSDPSISPYIKSATLGVFDLSKTNSVKSAMGGVCKAMKAEIDNGDAANYKKFLDGAYSYSGYDLADLATMADSLSGAYSGETKKLKSALGDMLVEGSTTIKGTCGLSVYFPLTNSAADYNASKILYSIGGYDLITTDPIDNDYKALMEALYPAEGGSKPDSSSSKPEESSSKAESSSKKEESSSKAESSSKKEESSSKAESSSKKEDSSSKAESSSKKEESSSKAESSSKKEESSSKAESSSKKEDSSSKADDSSKPDSSKPTEKSIYDELDIEVVPKGGKSSNKKYKDDGYAYAQLTDEQMKEMRGVYFTILTNVGFEGKEKAWAPRLLYVPAEVDKNGIVKMDLDPVSIGVVSDKQAEPISCLTKFMGNGNYRSAGVLCADQELSDERMSVLIESSVDSKGTASITGLTSNNTTSGGLPVASKDEIDLSEWMSFSSPFSGFEPNEKTPRKHYSELEATVYGGEFMAVGESFDVKSFHFSEMPAEYAIQMSIFTLDGKEYCSNIGSYEFKDSTLDKMTEEKTDNGVLKFAIVGDHAELVKYESKNKDKDGKIEVPAKVGGKAVTVVRTNAFDDSDPTELIFPDSVETMGRISNQGQRRLTKVTLPKNLRFIPENMFSYDSALETVVLPEKLESIGSFAFSSTAIKEIEIPASVTVIDPAAFSNCAKLDKLTVSKDNKVYTAKDNVLYTADMKKLIAFTGQSRTEFTIPDGVEEIGAYAFVGSYDPGLGLGFDDEGKGLTKITFAKSVKKIGDFAFQDCIGFSELTLPDALEYIGTSAFGAGFGHKANVELAELKIGANVKRVRGYAFTGYKVKKLVVDSKNSYFKTDGKKLTSIDGSTEITVFAEK